MSFIIILLIILGILNSSLPITIDSVRIKNMVQSDTEAHRWFPFLPWNGSPVRFL